MRRFSAKNVLIEWRWSAITSPASPVKAGALYRGPAFRAHNPRWSWAPLSGEGAALYGGRFNAQATPALYLATDAATAMREAAHGFPLKLVDPLTIVSYEVDCADIVDLTSAAVRRAKRIVPEQLGCGWLALQQEKRPLPSQLIAARLIADGAAGILVRSFAPGSTENNINLVLWRWSDKLPHKVRVHDPDRRLPKDGRSWGR